jgi:hypothetical protein
MDRRDFFKNIVMASAGTAFIPGVLPGAKRGTGNSLSPKYQGTWVINANGSIGELFIGFDQNTGNLVDATAFDNPVYGFLDGSRRISFVRVIDPNDPTTIQVYTGYFLGEDLQIAGTFTAFQGTGGVASDNIYGWYAYLP